MACIKPEQNNWFALKALKTIYYKYLLKLLWGGIVFTATVYPISHLVAQVAIVSYDNNPGIVIKNADPRTLSPGTYEVLGSLKFKEGEQRLVTDYKTLTWKGEDNVTRIDDELYFQDDEKLKSNIGVELPLDGLTNGNFNKIQVIYRDLDDGGSINIEGEFDVNSGRKSSDPDDNESYSFRTIDDAELNDLITEQVVNTSNAEFMQKNALYLLGRELGWKNDVNWRYGSDSGNTVIQRRFNRDIRDIEFLDFYGPNIDQIQGINIRAGIEFNNTRALILTWPEMSGQVRTINGQRFIRLDIKNVIAKSFDVSRNVFLKELVIHSREENPSNVVSRVEFKKIDDDSGITVLDKTVKHLNDRWVMSEIDLSPMKQLSRDAILDKATLVINRDVENINSRAIEIKGIYLVSESEHKRPAIYGVCDEFLNPRKSRPAFPDGIVQCPEIQYFASFNELNANENRLSRSYKEKAAIECREEQHEEACNTDDQFGQGQESVNLIATDTNDNASETNSDKKASNEAVLNNSTLVKDQADQESQEEKNKGEEYISGFSLAGVGMKVTGKGEFSSVQTDERGLVIAGENKAIVELTLPYQKEISKNSLAWVKVASGSEFIDKMYAQIDDNEVGPYIIPIDANSSIPINGNNTGKILGIIIELNGENFTLVLDELSLFNVVDIRNNENINRIGVPVVGIKPLAIGISEASNFFIERDKGDLSFSRFSDGLANRHLAWRTPIDKRVLDSGNIHFELRAPAWVNVLKDPWTAITVNTDEGSYDFALGVEELSDHLEIEFNELIDALDLDENVFIHDIDWEVRTPKVFATGYEKWHFNAEKKGVSIVPLVDRIFDDINPVLSVDGTEYKDQFSLVASLFKHIYGSAQKFDLGEVVLPPGEYGVVELKENPWITLVKVELNGKDNLELSTALLNPQQGSSQEGGHGIAKIFGTLVLLAVLMKYFRKLSLAAKKGVKVVFGMTKYIPIPLLVPFQLPWVRIILSILVIFSAYGLALFKETGQDENYYMTISAVILTILWYRLIADILLMIQEYFRINWTLSTGHAYLLGAVLSVIFVILMGLAGVSSIQNHSMVIGYFMLIAFLIYKLTRSESMKRQYI